MNYEQVGRSGLLSRHAAFWFLLLVRPAYQLKYTGFGLHFSAGAGLQLQLAIVALFLSMAIYGGLAILHYKALKNSNDLFHFSGRLLFFLKAEHSSAISLVAASITLGTGFVYLISLAHDQGVLAFVAPIGVLVGYLILAWLISLGELPESTNNLAILRPKHGFPILFYGVSLLIIATFVLIIGVEIYASAYFLKSLLLPAFSDNAVIALGLALFAIALVYTVIGGIRGVILTDIIQMVFILFSIVIIYVISISPESIGINPAELDKPARISIWPQDPKIYLLALSAFITAVATQFYSAVNIAMASNFDQKKQAHIFRIVGVALIFVLSSVIVLGFFWPSKGSTPVELSAVFRLLTNSENHTAQISAFILVFGFLGILLSSIDSVLISVSQLYRDAFSKHNSYDTSVDHSCTGRLTIGCFGLLAFLPIIVLFYWRPDIVDSLLAILTSLTFLAPIIAVNIIIKSSGKTSLTDFPLFGGLILFLVLCGWAIGIYDVINGSKQYSAWITVIGTVIFFLFSIGFYKSSK